VSATFPSTVKPAVSLPDRVTAAIASVAGKPPVALHEPHFRGNELAYLKECIDTTFVSSVGKFVDRFETEIASYTEAKHAVAVVNGTAALHMALLLADVKPGDEVLVPALTFIATVNAVCYCGATPHFVDSEERTLGMAAAPLREYLQRTTERRAGHCVNKATGKVIRAILPMHTFGHPVDIEGLLALSRDFGLALIEDAAESLGSRYHGRHTGNFGLLGTLSFNGNKTITTGGGGAILVNDAALARRAKHLTTTARLPHRWDFDHDEVGYNYRMPNINAALGCAQLERLSEMLEAKRRLFERYREAFRDMRDVHLMQEPAGCRSNYWLQALLLDESACGQRDAVLAAANDAGFMTRPVWKLTHRLKPFQNCPRAPLDVAESLERRVINIPSSAFLA
jgi:perosamine synthetase